jgi:ribosomal protein S18 acetylase RimI-like enzyme
MGHDPCSQGVARAVRIRAATRADIPALVACATSSTSEDESVGYGTPWGQRTFTDDRRLMGAWQEPNRVGNEEIFVAELRGHVVGYVTTEAREKELELVNIDVAGERQGQGIGHQLVRSVEEKARQTGRRAVTLGTSRNAAGVPWKSFTWWQAQGYEVTGE